MDDDRKSRLIGVTGGIGSGKSTVCRIFQCLDIPVYDADSRAKWLMNHNKELKQQIQQSFGSSAYTKEGKLDTNYMANHVFSSDNQLKKLNSLVHPAVYRDTDHWMADHKEYPLLIKEAALLFETGSYRSLDQTILVSADEQIRIDRVLKRDPQRSREQIQSIIAKQMDESDKRRLADFIITNDEQHSLLDQVLHFIKRIGLSEHVTG